MQNSLLKKIELLIDRAHFEHALFLIDKSIEQNGLNLQSIKFKSICIKHLSNPNEAYEFCLDHQAYFNDKPAYFTFLLQLALDAINKQATINIANQLLETFPNNLNTKQQAAQAFMKTGDYPKAISIQQEILSKSDFKRLGSYQPLALMNMQLQKYAVALNNISKTKPSLTQFDYMLLCFMHLNQWENAQQIINQFEDLREQIADQPDKQVFSFFEFFWVEYQKNPELIIKLKEFKSVSLKHIINLWQEHPKTILLSNLLLIELRKNGIIEKNNTVQVQNSDRIPKKLWQYWDKPTPPKDVQFLMQTWKNHNPDWQYHCFNDDEATEFLARFSGDVLQAYENAYTAAMKCDVFRLALLYEYGGVYTDADNGCFDSLNHITNQCKALVVNQHAHGGIGNNLIMTSAKNPIIYAALMDAVQQVNKYQNNNIFFATGPGCLTKAIASSFYDYLDSNLAEEKRPNILIHTIPEAKQYCSPHIGCDYKKTEQSWLRTQYKKMQDN